MSCILLNSTAVSFSHETQQCHSHRQYTGAVPVCISFNFFQWTADMQVYIIPSLLSFNCPEILFFFFFYEYKNRFWDAFFSVIQPNPSSHPDNYLTFFNITERFKLSAKWLIKSQLCLMQWKQSWEQKRNEHINKQREIIHLSTNSTAHLRPLLLNDVDYVICKISLNDYFILCCNWGTTREFLGKESLSLFKFNVCNTEFYIKNNKALRERELKTALRIIKTQI